MELLHWRRKLMMSAHFFHTKICIDKYVTEELAEERTYVYVVCMYVVTRLRYSAAAL